MKIVFMGTPDFAVPSLAALLDAGHQVDCVVTQPDRAKNRGKKVQPSPVKVLAQARQIPVLQPDRIRDSAETMTQLRALAPDLIVVAAYGQILQPALLALPRFGCVNVHASLLPRLRGASPIQQAILQGEAETGVTIMQMGEGLDTGDILAQAATPVDRKRCDALHDELAQMGAALLVETLPRIAAGTVTPIPQDGRLATYAGMIRKEDGAIDFCRDAADIERQIRAFDPWPGAYCRYGSLPLKIWEARVLEETADAQPGTVVSVSDAGIDICCGSGTLRAQVIQMPGKKRVQVRDFLRGNRLEPALRLR